MIITVYLTNNSTETGKLVVSLTTDSKYTIAVSATDIERRINSSDQFIMILHEDKTFTFINKRDIVKIN